MLLLEVESRPTFSHQSLQDVFQASELSEDGSGMCQLDVAMMDCVHRLATNAVAASHLELKPSNSMERRAAKWLEEWAELARDGKLLPAAIAATTVLSQPCLVTSPETAYSKRQLLLSQRWQLAPHARKACAQSKLLAPAASRELL